MKWLKERDELIAQTEAFVKSVTARRPEAPAATVAVKSAPIANPFASVAARPALADAVPVAAPKLLPVEPVAVAEPIPAQPVARAESFEPPRSEPSRSEPLRSEPPPIDAFAVGDVRKEIENRVAAFRANQYRFQREREAYYNSVLTKARATGDGFSDGSSS